MYSPFLRFICAPLNITITHQQQDNHHHQKSLPPPQSKKGENEEIHTKLGFGNPKPTQTCERDIKNIARNYYDRQ